MSPDPCIECSMRSEEQRTCATCASYVCVWKCGRNVYTVMWDGDPTDTFTCRTCIADMKMCRSCSAWSNSKSSICVRCAEVRCIYCLKREQETACAHCKADLAVKITDVVNIENLGRLVVDYLI